MDQKFIKSQFEKSGLQSRDAQQQMMEAVSDAIKKKKIAIIEGGTGIGKTLGYLIPALLTKKKNQKIVLATATVSLQLQLMDKDIPLASKILGREVKAEIAKGRRRYVCLNRLFNGATQSQSELELFGIEADPAEDISGFQVIVDNLIDQVDKGWNGDRDILSVNITDKEWQKVSTDAAGCSGRRCAYIKECPFFKAKSRVKTTDVVIANHDILLSDLSLGSGALLPDSEETIYIIDEAHHFPAKAINHFAATSTLLGARVWLNRVRQFRKRLLLVLSLDPAVVDAFDAALTDLSKNLFDAYEELSPIFNLHQKEGEWLLAEPFSKLDEIAKIIIADAKRLQELLYTFRKQIRDEHNEKTLPDFEALVQALGFFVTKNHGLIRSWELFITQDPKAVSPIAKWISERSSKEASRDFQIHAAYTCASRFLPNFFWDRVENGVILSSATLQSLGEFKSFLEKAGLTGNSRVKTYAFESPFDYSKSKLVIPEMKTLPTGAMANKFADEVAEKLPAILEAEQFGVLVLFTSNWMMSHVFELLDMTIREDILMQGMFSKRELVAEHKKKVDGGGKSIIFGLQSFAEGMDLPGNYCNHVIITKIPFAVPTTPVESTRVSWLEAQGRNPFAEHSLPEAGLKLTQYCGRLVRHETDCGTVTILDRRLVQKHYGKKLLAGLPAFERVE